MIQVHLVECLLDHALTPSLVAKSLNVLAQQFSQLRACYVAFVLSVYLLKDVVLLVDIIFGEELAHHVERLLLEETLLLVLSDVLEKGLRNLYLVAVFLFKPRVFESLRRSEPLLRILDEQFLDEIFG